MEPFRYREDAEVPYFSWTPGKKHFPTWLRG